jgi:guanylate kinase
VVKRLVLRDPNLWLSRSWSTRARRPGEAADAYHWVDRAAFERHIASGGFLEWAPFLDYLQGTPLPDPPSGQDVLLEIDVQGARQVKERFPDALLLFLDVPSEAAQRARLEARGDRPERIEQRLALADTERRAARALGAQFIVNDTLDQAVADVAAAIEAARQAHRR